MQLNVNLKDCAYPITIQRNALNNIQETIQTNRKIMIITDSGVPQKWIDIVSSQCLDSFIVTIPNGEQSKCFKQYEELLLEAIEHEMTRKDAIIALGGGVVGDLAGFVAATYMRGIDFYNIPTTLLSQVDSSVGGKVAIDAGNYKNIVGAFWQPKAVIIDPNVLSTLPQRHINNGLVEALKTGLIQGKELVELFKQDDLDIDQIIYRSINVKRKVVEQDERESSLRKILNFGHTIGHAIEGAYGLDTYLHGECVAMGMLFFIDNKELKEDVLKIYEKLHLPKVPDYDVDTLMNFIQHDKKSSSSSITIVLVKQAGTYELQEVSYDTIKTYLERGPYEK